MALLDLLSPSRKVRQDSEALRENNHGELRAAQRLEELRILCFLGLPVVHEKQRFA